MEPAKNKVNKCNLCGMCKSNCPVFRVTLMEKHSPRGKAVMIKEDLLSLDVYKCTLCGACRVECPNDIDLELLKKREQLVKEGRTTKANKRMIKNIRKYGNPFGEVEEGVEPKDLYCC